MHASRIMLAAAAFPWWPCKSDAPDPAGRTISISNKHYYIIYIFTRLQIGNLY
jgi:hypothetical protein